MAFTDILKNIAINLANSFADRGFKMLVDAYYDEKLSQKYEELDILEEAQIREPIKVEAKKIMPTFLLPYNNKEVLLGFTWCPFCKEEYEKMKDKIIEDKADVIWIDNDVVGEVLAEDFDLDYVPAKVRVKAKGDKAIVELLDDEGKVVSVRKYVDIFAKQKLKKAKTKKNSERK